MATYSRPAFLPAILLLLVLSSMTLQGADAAGRGVPASDKKQKQGANGGRGVPAATSADKKQTECVGGEGTYLIPGIGRYAAGSTELPSIGGLDSSGPAAANQRYIPGGDDTFVPNPGYEVPNPFHVGGATTP